MQALERLSLGGRRIRETVIAQSRILLFFYLTTYLLLKKNKPKYQKLEPQPLDKSEPWSKLEYIEFEDTEKSLQVGPLSSGEAEMKLQQFEQSLPPALDQIRPFILEGL